MIGAKERDVARESNGERNGLADRALPVDKLDEGRRWLSARPPSSNRATRSGEGRWADFMRENADLPVQRRQLPDVETVHFHMSE